jgi:hypothetical protein
MSPTQRTQAELRKQGYTVANCERKVPCTPAGYKGLLKTQDLFEFIDTMAVNDFHLLAVQSTDGSHHSTRANKILETEVAKSLAYHMDIEVWSWAKRGPRGKAKRWTLRRESLTVRLLPKKSMMRRVKQEGTFNLF